MALQHRVQAVLVDLDCFICRIAARADSSAAIIAATRAGQFTQASRSSRASLNTWATALARSTSSPFMLLQAQPALLGLEHLVGGPGLHEGHAARGDRLAVLAQGVAHRADRRLRYRLQRGSGRLRGSGFEPAAGRCCA